MNRQKIALAVGIVCLSVGTAHAANHGFSGPYLGATIGAVQGNFTTTEYNGFWDYGEYSVTTDLQSTYGIQAGWDMAVGNGGVVGAELSYNWLNLEDKRRFSSGSYINKASWNNEMALRLRGGIAADRTLFYGTAGVVQQDVDFTFGDTTTPSSILKKNVTNMGLSYGAGVEVKMMDNLSVKGEYLINDSQSKKVTMAGDTGDFHSDTKSFNIGVNYRF